MSNAEEKFIKYWKKYSLMGKTKYILLALLFAVVAAVITEVVFSYIWRSDSFTLKSLSQRMLIMSLFGYFYGSYSWKTNEKRFQELSKPKPSQDSENITSSEGLESQ